WIKACLESSRNSVLINGSPTSEFNVRRGLRQGDPLSPFLFIIIMEGLHMGISDSVRSGLIRGINIGSSNIFLSHLFFANDVVITTEWSQHDMDNVPLTIYIRAIFSLWTPFASKWVAVLRDCLIMDRISNWQWAWNWSSNLGVRNSAHLNELLLEISLLNVREDNDNAFGL
ncbi:putative RNA-directed DNA polymerase, eukaryota, reverse transcriptase zinc-binding domain protein, partial [Tanacetum coccineum]